MTIRRSALLFWSSLGCLFAVGLLAGSVGAQRTQPLLDSVPAHDTFTVASRALAEARLISVHTPPGYHGSSTARFPVLYMPDGDMDEDFPHVVHTVDWLIALGAVRSVIVVGIPNTERRRDFTGPTRVAADSAIAPRVGGSATFRRFISDELIPAVGARYRTTAERAIVSESLAGLFVVETFIREPALFDHYVAFDPSLWWNRGALVDSAPALLAVGRPAPSRGKVTRMLRSTIYVAGSRDDIADGTARLAAALQAAAPIGLTLIYVPRPDLTHATIFRALGPEALESALR